MSKEIAILTATNFGPRNGNSHTNTLCRPRSDQLVRYAIIGPTPVPAFQNLTNIGNVRNGPLGVTTPNAVPMDMPLIPDSLPIQVEINSFGRISTNMLDIRNDAMIRYANPYCGWKSWYTVESNAIRTFFGLTK